MEQGSPGGIAMLHRLLMSAMASGVLLGALGCHHHCCRSGDSPRPYHPPPPGGPFMGAPGGPGSTIPPAGVPITPGGTVVPGVGPAGGAPVPRPSDLPPPDPLFGTPREGNFRPAPPPGQPAPEILLPDPLPGGSSSRSSPAPSGGVLGAPIKAPGQSPEPPLARAPGAATT